MLQKGFLKSRETKETLRAAKRSRMFFITGTVVVLFSLIYTMLHHSGRIGFITGVCLLIVGFCMISVSMWMNFITQNKHRRR